MFNCFLLISKMTYIAEVPDFDWEFEIVDIQVHIFVYW